jgi:hypothetical protein
MMTVEAVAVDTLAKTKIDIIATNTDIESDLDIEVFEDLEGHLYQRFH